MTFLIINWIPCDYLGVFFYRFSDRVDSLLFFYDDFLRCSEILLKLVSTFRFSR